METHDKNPGVSQAIAADEGALPTPADAVARRIHGESNILTLRLRFSYALALCGDNGRTIDDVREAVKTLAETERIARRVLGCAHPSAVEIGRALGLSREALSAREETA